MPRSFIVSIKLVCESEPRSSVTEHLNWVKTTGAYEIGSVHSPSSENQGQVGTGAELDA